MARNYLTAADDLTAVADAIRAKGGTSAALVFPDGFVTAVAAIESQPPAVTAIDYSNLSSGTFTETLDSGQTVNYTVTLDDSGQVSTIFNGEYTTTVTWG